MFDWIVGWEGIALSAGAPLLSRSEPRLVAAITAEVLTATRDARVEEDGLRLRSEADVAYVSLARGSGVRAQNPRLAEGGGRGAGEACRRQFPSSTALFACAAPSHLTAGSVRRVVANANLADAEMGVHLPFNWHSPRRVP